MGGVGNRSWSGRGWLLPVSAVLESICIDFCCLTAHHISPIFHLQVKAWHIIVL